MTQEAPRQLQTERLTQCAETSDRWLDLVYYHAALRDMDALHALESKCMGRHPEDALAFQLMAGHDQPPDAETMLAALPHVQNRWLFYTMAKACLQRDDIGSVLRVVSHVMRQREVDPFVLNLAAKWASASGQWSLAAQIAERSINLGAYQQDIRYLFERAQREETEYANPRLDLLPHNPPVGFYIPVFNVSSFIRSAIEGLLCQNHPLVEIVAVDDASPDDSIEQAREYPVRVVAHSQNKGLAASRNTAFYTMRSCEFIGAIDTDARPDPAFAQTMLMEFENGRSRLAGVGGRLIEEYTDTPPDRWRAIQLCQDHGLVRFYASIPESDGTEKREEERFFQLHMMWGIFGACTFFRREHVLAVGGYTEACGNNAEDMDLGIRLKQNGFEYAFTPHAKAYHQRRDDLLSVLKTQWNYVEYYFGQRGAFDSADGLLELLERRMGDSVTRIRKDFEVKEWNNLYISFLVFVYSMLRDARVVADRGAITTGQARRMQDFVMEWVASLDAAGGGDLAGKVRADLRDEFLGQDIAPEPFSSEHEARMQDFLRRMAPWLESHPDDTYAMLLAYPHAERAPGADLNELPAGAAMNLRQAQE